MNPANDFLTGVVEGYYGRSWCFDTRLAYADFLVQAGLNTFLYCPKSDSYLRKQWQQHWPGREWRQLQALSLAYRQRGIYWGVGLSPFALYRDYGPGQREQLRRKIGQLAELESPLLAILFDDMPGNLDALASRQAEIVADVTAWMPEARVLVCPTYYSFDPVLEKFFGVMPEGYWAQLGRELPAAVDIFWTGERVCSEAITREDIRRIRDQLQRPVILWDNYPVNDGAQRSNFLYLDKLSQREALPPDLLSGHLCNPMNQGLLSLLALTGLSELYRGREGGELRLEQFIDRRTLNSLQRDCREFRDRGLAGMGEERRAHLAEEYAALPGAAAVEVVEWLQGKYGFDPACLTD